MNNAGSMLHVAGNSFEQSIALLTAANTTIQNISKASTGLRTIAARIRKTTTGEDDDGEIVEEAKYQEMVNALTKQHVSLVDEVTGQYRSTYDIIRDIAGVWKDMTSMEQAAVVEALAGTRQQNIFASLMTQFGEAEDAMERMNNSAGELQESYDIYLGSIQAHVQTLKAAFDELSRDFVDSGFAKSVVDILTSIVELLDFFIDKIGVIGTLIGASALPGIIKLIASGKFTSTITQLAGALGLLQSSSTALSVVGASGAAAGASMAAFAPIIMGVVAAFAALAHVLNNVEQQRRQAITDTYNSAMQHAKEQDSVYDLYLAYLDAKEKQDETEESKQRLKKASEDLAVALGYEKDAADSLNESFAQMSAEQIKKAASDAKIAIDSAQKQLLDTYKNTSSSNGNGQAFVSLFGRGAGIDISTGTQEERAEKLVQVYDLMRERQRELSESSQTTTREYINLSDSIKWLKPQVDDLSDATETLGDAQEHVNDIVRGTTDPAKKLAQALDRLSDNAVEGLLTGEYYDEDLEEIMQVMQEYYATPERMQSALLSNSNVILNRVSQPLENAKKELANIQAEVAQQGIDISRTVFGNIDTNNRQVLEWTEDNLERFKSELESWGEDIDSMAGSISTVFGGSANYDGVEIAFSPILQTDKGPVLLSQETVDDYIWSLVEELNKTKEKWSNEDLFELDARGIEKDGRKIKGLIADVGETAEKTSRSMHYLGKDGALALAERGVQEAQNFLNLFADEITPSGITNSVEKSVADLSTLRDELKLSIEALEDYKTAMEGGEIDDPIKEAAEIYKGALEDILSGRKGTNRVKNAAEMFLGRDTLNAIGWDLEEAGKMLQDHMWKFILDPEGTSDYDYGARVAQYIQANFDKATDGVWMENGKFYYESLDKLAAAFHNSTTAASLFLGALQAHSVNTINSVEENQRLIASFKDLEDELHSTDAAVRQTVEDMFNDGMDDFQIHDTLEAFREAGLIDIDDQELHTIIGEVLDHLHEVDTSKTEAEIGIKYDKVTQGINLITQMLVDLVTNGGHGWNIDVGIQSSGSSQSSNSDQNSSGQQNNNSKANVYAGGVNYPGHVGGKQAGSSGGKTLVNEDGPELISDNGRAFIANNGKPGFVTLTKDAIVFNAEDTEEILRRGSLAGVAQAFANGTGSTSRSGLVGRLLSGRQYPAKRQVHGTQVGGSSTSKPSQHSTSTHTNTTSYTTYSTYSNTAWICPNCGRLCGANASYCYGCGWPDHMQSNLPNTNSNYYPDQYGNVTVTYGDGQEYSYNSGYDYSLQLQIAEAQRAHEQAMEALRAAQAAKAKADAEKASGSKIDSTSKNTTLGKSLAGSGGGNYVGGANYASYAEPQKVDWVAVRINRLQRTIADLEKIASSGFKKLDTRLRYTKDQITNITDELKVQQQAYDRYIQEANSIGLSESIAANVREGTIDITKYDDDTRKKIDEYTEWYEKAIDAKSALEELHQNIAQLYVDSFDMVQTDFENQLAQIEHDANMTSKNLEMAQTKGYLDSATFYEQLVSNQADQVNRLNMELTELNQKFKEAMDSGEIEENSEAWYTMKQSINEVEEAIADANIQLVQYQRTIRQLDWSYFDYAQERFSQMTAEAQFFVDLMSNHELFQDNGQFNNLGEATAGMHAVNYDVYMAQADEYAKQIQKIQRDLESDPYDTELISRREQLLELQRQSILSAEGEKNAVKDLVQNGINLELQALKDLIDAYNDSLDSAKDLYEYQKSITEKTADIASIQKQLSAYQNDTSEETRARVQKLTQNLEKAQTELRETEWDRSISDQKKLLDDMYDEYEDYLNQRLDNIDLLMQEMITGTNINMDSIRNTLIDVGEEVGYTMTDQMTQALSADLNYYEHMSGEINSVQVVLSNIYDMVAAMARASGAVKAYATGGLVDYTGLAAVHGSKGKPELMLNASDTANFLEAAKMMREMAGSSISIPSTSGFGNGGGMTIGQLQVNIPIDRVLDYNDLISQLRDDPKFERLVNAMTLDRAVGKSAFWKNKIVF